MNDQIAVRVFDRNTGTILTALRQALPDVHVTDAPLADQADTRKALICFTPPRDEPIGAYDWIHTSGAGVDRIIAALDPGEAAPVITRTVGEMGRQIAEYCVCYALHWLQKVPVRQRLQADGDWIQDRAEPRYLFERTVGVIGTGTIGRSIGAAFRAFGAHVTGYSRRGQHAEGFDTVHALEQFGETAAPDILVLALPRTAHTNNLVGADLLSHLTRALLINIGRGTTLDLDALQPALDGGQVAQAVLDVFPEEPVAQSHWCWHHPNVIVTPHISGLTRPEDAVSAFLHHFEAFRRGEPIDTGIRVEQGY